MKLSKAEVKALRFFSQPGGHGYGENSGIRTPTVHALKRKGLIEIGSIRGPSKWFKAAWTVKHLIICPYCREVMSLSSMERTDSQHDFEHLGPGEDGLSYCLSCRREISIGCQVSVSYTAFE